MNLSKMVTLHFRKSFLEYPSCLLSFILLKLSIFDIIVRTHFCPEVDLKSLNNRVSFLN